MSNELEEQKRKLLADQVADWRKEVARLQDMIAHATGSPAAPGTLSDEQVVQLARKSGFREYGEGLLCADADGYSVCCTKQIKKLVSLLPAAGNSQSQDAVDAARYRFRKSFLESGGCVIWATSGCQYRKSGELVAIGKSEEEAIDAAIAAMGKQEGGDGA